jgi:hypothetical protein
MEKEGSGNFAGRGIIVANAVQEVILQAIIEIWHCI